MNSKELLSERSQQNQSPNSLAEYGAFLEGVREKTFYAGLFVNREELYQKAPAHLEHAIEKPHVTTKFAPEAIDLHLDQLGSGAKIIAIGYGNNGKNEGLLVKVEADDPIIQAAVDKLRNPHITLSYSEGAHPKDTAALDFIPLEGEDQFEIPGIYSLHLKDNSLVDNPNQL